MLSFYAFGSVLATFPGAVTPVRFLALSLGSAVAGSVGYVIQQAFSEPRRRSVAIGASGMVMGLGSAAAMLAPRQTMLLFGILPVPLWGLMAGYFVYDAFYLGKQSRVAHSGHVGGAIFGAGFYWLVLRRFGGVGFRF